MSESSDELCDGLALPLRGHVSDSVDGREGELAAVLEVAGEVPVGRPGPPLLRDRPRLLLDPPASAQSGYCTVCVPRVVHQAVTIRVAEQDVVDPD